MNIWSMEKYLYRHKYKYYLLTTIIRNKEKIIEVIWRVRLHACAMYAMALGLKILRAST
jgi:hypothetical protein